MKYPGRILLIDDDPDDQLFFRDAVNFISEQLRCDLASGFDEAMSKLIKGPLPGIIFLDLNMPLTNGFDCLAYLKSQSHFKQIPVVIYTTSRSINDISKTQQLGADFYLTKPDDFNVLCKKLNKILQKEVTNGKYTV